MPWRCRSDSEDPIALRVERPHEGAKCTLRPESGGMAPAGVIEAAVAIARPLADEYQRETPRDAFLTGVY